jgi:hypothetical protein
MVVGKPGKLQAIRPGNGLDWSLVTKTTLGSFLYIGTK